MADDAPVAPQPPSQIVMPQFDGLSLVSWQDAESHMGEEIVVFGTISQVRTSNSGKTRYLQFDANRSKIKVALLVRLVNVSEEELAKRFLEKHVCVRGMVGKSFDYSEIQVADLNHILVVDRLPGPATRLVTEREATANSMATSGAFAGMPNGLEISELTRETTDFARQPLGPIHVGDGLLGLFLTVPEQACERPVWFDIQRDPANPRRWEIGFAARSADAESDRKVVAEIHLEQDQLFFNWVAAEDFEPLVNYLQNCLLEIKTTDESKTVLMRKPVEMEPVILSEKRPNVSGRKITLSFMPVAESISVEFLPLPEDEFDPPSTDEAVLLNLKTPEACLYFDALPENQFFRIWYRAAIGPSIRLDVALQINGIDKPFPFNTRSVKDLERRLSEEQTRLALNHEMATEYQAPAGKKNEHKQRLKDSSQLLERVNSQVVAFHATRPMAEKVPGRSLPFRVYYTIGDTRYLLATTPSPMPGADADIDSQSPEDVLNDQ